MVVFAYEIYGNIFLKNFGQKQLRNHWALNNETDFSYYLNINRNELKVDYTKV